FAIEQPQITPSRVQLKIRVQPIRRGRRASIFARCEQHKELPYPKVCRRKHPFPRISRIIGQRPSPKIDPARPAILNLDPVLRLAVLILPSARIRREEFVDAHVRKPGGLVQSVTPRASCESVRRAREIPNLVIARPSDLHRSLRRRRKLEQITPRPKHAYARRRSSID